MKKAINMCIAFTHKQFLMILFLFIILAQSVNGHVITAKKMDSPIEYNDYNLQNKSEFIHNTGTIDTTSLMSQNNKINTLIERIYSVNHNFLLGKIKVLNQELYQQQHEFQRTIFLIIIIIAMIISLIASGRFLMEKRIQQIEENTFMQLCENSIETDNSSQLQLPLAKDESVEKSLKDKKIIIVPERPQKKPLLSPEKQIKLFVECAGKFKNIRKKPRLAKNPWSLGLATIKGNVRPENQDYGLCFQLNGHDVLILADGCGGIPHGQRASYLAVLSAAMSITRTYGMSQRWYTLHVKDVSAKALLAAAHSLTVEGDKLNIVDIRGGLRTTLIIVIGNKREIGYTYIGDGGGCVIKTSGEIHKFLEPQKANEFSLNVLAASLGPMMEGEPVAGVFTRMSGDMLIVGTDGIFDRIDKDFPKDVIKGCIHYNGDLQKTADHIVNELASFKDSAGYICDDNLTLGIMGDGTELKLS